MKTRIDSDRQRRQNVNFDQAGNNLERFREQVLERWNELSGEQVETIAGRREQLLQELQRTYGFSPEEAEAEVQRFEAGEPGHAMTGSGRGPTERMREFGTGNDQGGHPRNDKHSLH